MLAELITNPSSLNGYTSTALLYSPLILLLDVFSLHERLPAFGHHVLYRNQFTLNILIMNFNYYISTYHNECSMK